MEKSVDKADLLQTNRKTANHIKSSSYFLCVKKKCSSLRSTDGGPTFGATISLSNNPGSSFSPAIAAVNNLPILMIGIRIVLKKAWAIINDERSSEKAVANALHLVLDCYSFKRQLLVDVTNIAPVIRDFIEDQEQEQQKQVQMEEYSKRQAVFGPEMEDGNAHF